jgi:hypothetical protein
VERNTYIKKTHQQNKTRTLKIKQHKNQQAFTSTWSFVVERNVRGPNKAKKKLKYIL